MRESDHQSLRWGAKMSSTAKTAAMKVQCLDTLPDQCIFMGVFSDGI